jgi:serine/threonine protein kinase
VNLNLKRSERVSTFSDSFSKYVIAEAFHQVVESHGLQGLQFIHKQHVAHRYDRIPLPLDGWHPCNRRRMRDNFRLLAKHFSRTERPPKYYFIDFGISRRYGPEDKAPLELPIRGSDKTVPEFMDNINLPRNPFQTIYYVGNLIREAVIDVSNEPFSLAPQFLTIARHSNIRVSILCGL